MQIDKSVRCPHCGRLVGLRFHSEAPKLKNPFFKKCSGGTSMDTGCGKIFAVHPHIVFDAHPQVSKLNWEHSDES